MQRIYVSKRNDRLGMRLYAVIRTIYYCQTKKLNYRHVSLSHNKKEYKIYNKLFNFNKKYKGIKYNKYAKYDNKIVINIGPTWECINKTYDNYKTKEYIKYRKSLINLYNESSLYNNVYNDKNINICIHYRRGDSKNYKKAKFKNINYIGGKLYTNKKKLKLRYTPDNYINQIITKLNKYMNDLPLNIHIHSDSRLNMDKLLTRKHNFNIHTHFQDSAYDSLNSMIQCDILFRYGLSSFSGVAAFYNSNVVISKIDNEFKGLYNYNNVYNFSKCGNILRKLANKYKNIHQLAN
jgi:hypothetical protein